jgi:hypothetical protein
MGLAEKRAQTEFEQEQLTPITTALNTATGTPIAVEVNWQTFTSADAITKLPRACFGFLTEGIQLVCRDTVGKEAFNEAVKKVQIEYTADESKTFLKVANGTLTYASPWDGPCNTEGWIKTEIEKAL